MKGGRIVIVGLFAGLILSAPLGGCSSSECYENHSALPLANFYSSASLKQVSLQSVEIYGIGAPNDSILYTTQTLSEAYLPFRIWDESTSYVIRYVGAIPDSIAQARPDLVPKDTITFHYKPREWFVSPSCGAMYFFDMEGVDHSDILIDSISTTEVITNENIANIKIFFKDGA